VNTAEYNEQLAQSVNEAWLAEQVRAACGQLGLLRYHTLRAKGSPAGFPDEVIVGRWVMFRELKRQRGQVAPAQRQWMTVLVAAGADVAIWRPLDWISGRITSELLALAGRSTQLPPLGGGDTARSRRTDDRGVTVRPGQSVGSDKARADASASSPVVPTGGAPC
jgi:hypothetical protein